MKKLLAITVFSAVAVFAGAPMKNNNEKPAAGAGNRIGNYFDQFIPADFYDKIKAGKFDRNIYPKFSDRRAWENARKSKYAEMIIAEADKVLTGNIPQLLFSEYRRFAFDGNRRGYQTLYHKRRADLAFLTLAMCLTGDKARYMPKVLDYTMAVLEEFSWVVPAHAYWKGDKYQQLGDVLSTDLFASETGAMMALIHHIIGEELDKEIENISSKIRKAALERTVYNVFYNPAPMKIGKLWWFELGDKKNNWTPWCSYNNIVVAVLLEEDTEKLAYFIRRFLQANAYFVGQYGDDGYCSEGPYYYSASGLMLFHIFRLLNKIQPGSMEKVFAAPKLRAIFEFIARVRIGEKYQINFSDTQTPLFAPPFGDMAICGSLLDSPSMRAIAQLGTASLGGKSQNLSVCLRLLFDVPKNMPAGKLVTDPFTCFKDRFAIFRSDKFSATVKAGSNAEPHNHNDLGHFTIYYRGEPVIIDAGTEYYSKTNFSARRYSLWYTRGAGHNAPVFGKTEQQPGANYTAVFTSAAPNKIVCDLGKAYPAEAGVKTFVRTLDFSPASVVVEDKFELAKRQAAQVKLLSLVKPEKLGKNMIKIGNVIVRLDGIDFAEMNVLPEMNGSWNRAVCEIILKGEGNTYKIGFYETDGKP